MKGWFAAALWLVVGCATFARNPDTPRAAVDSFLSAMANADEVALAATLTDDASVFLPFDSAPQRIDGKSAIRDAFGSYFAKARQGSAGPPYIHLDPKDFTIQQYGDAAVISFHLGRLPAEGATEAAMFSRRTFVVVKTPQGWRIAHLHASNVRVEPHSP